MSSIQGQVITFHQKGYMSLSKDWDNVVSAEKGSVYGKLLDTNTKCLLGLGVVPIVVGIATGIWPVALAGLGPWLLAWLDTNQRRRERER